MNCQELMSEYCEKTYDWNRERQGESQMRFSQQCSLVRLEWIELYWEGILHLLILQEYYLDRECGKIVNIIVIKIIKSLGVTDNNSIRRR